MPHDFLNVTEKVPLNEIKLGGIVLATDLVTKRRYNEAKKVLAKILTIIPKDADVMCLLANVHILDKKYADAETGKAKTETPVSIPCHVGQCSA